MVLVCRTQPVCYNSSFTRKSHDAPINKMFLYKIKDVLKKVLQINILGIFNFNYPYFNNQKKHQPCEFGSGRFSRGTRCITVVFPKGSPSAPSVTLLCRKRPWYINRRISALATASSPQSGTNRHRFFLGLCVKYFLPR